MIKHVFVIDVESIGLHGEGFAIAGGVYFPDGSSKDEFIISIDPKGARGSKHDRDWVNDNIPAINVTHESIYKLRNSFWSYWKEAQEKYPGIIMAAECGWPVEANFISSCIKDYEDVRGFSGPYPLHEIASFMLAAGMDPMVTYDRLESELPKHCPLKDARQSARLLFEALSKISVN